MREETPVVARFWAEARGIHALGLPAEFAEMQWRAWCLHVRDNFARAETMLVTLEGSPVGFVVWQPGSPAHLVELGVTSACRGQGIGTTVLKTLMSQSPQGMTLQVDPTSPARCLYERLGFEPVGDTGERIRMAWSGT